MQYQDLGSMQNQGVQDIVLDDFVDLESIFDTYLAELHSGVVNNHNNPAAVGVQQPNAQNGFGMPFQQGQFAQPLPQTTAFPNSAPPQQIPQPQAQPQQHSMFFNSLSAPPSNQQFSLNLPAVPPTAMQTQLQLQPPPITSGVSETGPGGKPAKGRGGRGGGRKPAAPKQLELEDSGDSSGADSASSDEPKSRKKRELSGSGDQSVADRRHQALQEKNRRAQRRFRERQKAKIQDLHKQIEDLTSRVGNLQTENSALQSRTSILEKVLEMRNEQIQVMQETKEDATEVEAVEGTNSALALTGSSLPDALNPESLKRLTPDEMTSIYQKYVGELKVRLLELNESHNPQLRQGVELLVKDVLLLLMRFSIVKPLETRKFVAGSRQSLPSEAEALIMWKSAMKLLELNEEQMKEMVVLKGIFLTKIESVMEQRRQLNVQIQAHFPHASFHTKIALAYIKAHEAVAKLKDNLRMEHRLVLEFSAALFKKILTPIQMATLLVHAFPAVPDSLAISSAVAADMGEEPSKPISGPSTSYLLQDGLMSGGLGGLGLSSQLLRPGMDPGLGPNLGMMGGGSTGGSVGGVHLQNTGSTEESGTTSGHSGSQA